MRLKPRFTVRSLAIFVTLVCAYLGAWEATKRYGTVNGFEATSPFPFIVVQTEMFELYEMSQAGLADPYRLTRRVYLWLGGPKIRLPIEFDPNPE